MITTISSNDFSSGSVIGSGSFAQVTKGFWDNKEVAIKTFILRSNDSIKKYQKQFEQEIEIHRQFSSPYIVMLLAICIDNSTAYCAIQEYMEGGSLRDILEKNNPKNPCHSTRWTILADVALALEHIHAHNFVHNDVKPENILLTKDNRAKLTDFGISTPIGTDTTSGTSEYMAPECIRGSTQYAVRNKPSDIYALGMVIWEVFFGQGKCPFFSIRQAYCNKYQRKQISTKQTVQQARIKVLEFIVYQNGKETIPDDAPQETANLIKNCWKIAHERPTARRLYQDIFAICHNEDQQTTTTTQEEVTLEDNEVNTSSCKHQRCV